MVRIPASQSNSVSLISGQGIGLRIALVDAAAVSCCLQYLDCRFGSDCSDFVVVMVNAYPSYFWHYVHTQLFLSDSVWLI